MGCVVGGGSGGGWCGVHRSLKVFFLICFGCFRRVFMFYGPVCIGLSRNWGF